MSSQTSAAQQGVRTATTSQGLGSSQQAADLKLDASVSVAEACGPADWSYAFSCSPSRGLHLACTEQQQLDKEHRTRLCRTKRSPHLQSAESAPLTGHS